ncbi:MarR family transcriptional regulator [Rhizohabitans arisaemae]|uniref:MarR family transcriptional regulator n=1 Tax=Rhizohabitans arisaemae TaxID=2720610 RepID=UPI0024B1ED4B|nr:MarR family transcriptional regulator [Rhizohabitans arisaemae]
MTEEDLVRTWRSMHCRHAMIWASLERTLQDRHNVGASEYEVLDRLAEATHGKLRVQELADAVCLSQSALSRLIARLESAGLVVRAMCDMDRRGIFVEMTGEGRSRHAEARSTHLAVLGEMLTDQWVVPPSLSKSAGPKA